MLVEQRVQNNESSIDKKVLPGNHEARIFLNVPPELFLDHLVHLRVLSP
jgi:hypothetical protein